MERYSTPDLLRVSKLNTPHFKQLVGRGQLRLSGEQHPGTGRPHRHTKEDLLQALLFKRLGQAGVTPRRAAMFWPLVQSALHHPEALLVVAKRDDDSDVDFRLVLPGGDAEMEHQDAPSVCTVISIGALKREVLARLDGLGPVA